MRATHLTSVLLSLANFPGGLTGTVLQGLLELADAHGTDNLFPRFIPRFFKQGGVSFGLTISVSLLDFLFT